MDLKLIIGEWEPETWLSLGQIHLDWLYCQDKTLRICLDWLLLRQWVVKKSVFNLYWSVVLGKSSQSPVEGKILIRVDWEAMFPKHDMMRWE